MSLFLLSVAMAACGLAGLCIAQGSPTAQAAQPAPASHPARDRTGEEALGWRLGYQSWTFRDRTAFEAIETAARLGLTCVELYPGQALSPEDRNARVGPSLSPAQIEVLKAKLQGVGITPLSYGVVSIEAPPANAADRHTHERELRGHFEFVRAMGMTTLVCEPAPEARDLVSRLAEEFALRVAIHNHPRPSLYWKPEAVLEALEGRSTLMGACADTGHWTRSGLRAVDQLKTLDGRVLELHFKDIANNLDVPWGTGRSDARALLAELKRQNFRGPVYIEYEAGSGAELDKNVVLCVAFFDAAARELAALPAPAPDNARSPAGR